MHQYRLSEGMFREPARGIFPCPEGEANRFPGRLILLQAAICKGRHFDQNRSWGRLLEEVHYFFQMDSMGAFD